MQVRKFIRKLMMLSPGYRKAFFVEQKLEKKSAELLAAIEAARPADRTGELLAAIEAARPADRTGELLAAIEAARPADRTGELLAAIEVLRLAVEKREESLRILQESQQTNYRISEFLNLYNQHAESAVLDDDHFVSYTYPTALWGPYGCNLGDYVQTIATESAISHVIGHEVSFRNVRRDQLTAHDGGTCVMQGWYEHGVLSFLPNRTTRAVWIGTHFETATQEALRRLWCTSPATIPCEIGCRDMTTLEFCEQLRIKAYFSRCLTLALPRRDASRHYGEVYLVDCPDWLLNALPAELRDVGRQMTQRDVRSPSPARCRAAAQALLSRYRDTARLVITTALHCALPCAAMGIPVVLVNPGYDEADRFSAAQGILPVYSREDVLARKVDFNPSAVDIEDLKRDILLNLKLSLAASCGELVDGREIASVRRRIRDFKFDGLELSR